MKCALVRTVELNGEPWFVLKDVCRVLTMDVSKIKQVSDRLDADEKGRYSVPTPGGVQQIVFRPLVVENGGERNSYPWRAHLWGWNTTMITKGSPKW